MHPFCLLPLEFGNVTLFETKTTLNEAIKITKEEEDSWLQDYINGCPPFPEDSDDDHDDGHDEAEYHSQRIFSVRHNECHFEDYFGEDDFGEEDFGKEDFGEYDVYDHQATQDEIDSYYDEVQDYHDEQQFNEMFKCVEAYYGVGNIPADIPIDLLYEEIMEKYYH